MPGYPSRVALSPCMEGQDSCTLTWLAELTGRLLQGAGVAGDSKTRLRSFPTLLSAAWAGY